ncbi:adaptor protein MecA [Lapidilactobacillus mulanensis]|uniref:Adapter protein MecA n=1 Tax=Lapidilactobacillus mulanensis TaxID=2485999 RepID=A0ABW4DPU7_9LACO|nr:adaptor protein MecA [Lapidilactobacillus mulanensis]
MEMERVDENTIRVVLGSDDLEARGVTMLDLLGNHQQIEKFFYSILEEVDADHVFADNDAVTFQVMPSKKGLELIISRLDDDETTDKESLTNAVMKRAKSAAKNQHQLNDLQKILQGTDVDDSDEDDLSRYLNDKDVDVRDVVLQLPDFEAMVQLADALRLEAGISNLYRYKGAYFVQLVLFTDEMREMSPDDAITIANEYGSKTNVTAEVLSEYGEKIMDQTALELTRHYFL